MGSSSKYRKEYYFILHFVAYYTFLDGPVYIEGDSILLGYAAVSRVMRPSQGSLQPLKIRIMSLVQRETAGVGR